MLLHSYQADIWCMLNMNMCVPGRKPVRCRESPLMETVTSSSINQSPKDPYLVMINMHCGACE